MFLATTLLYPCVLATLCIGSGLLIERGSGAPLAHALLIPVGAAGLIALSQLSTLVYPLAPATPYLMLAVALAGGWFGRAQALAHLRAARRRFGLLILSILAYAIALAPVLIAGRTSFSSYMALADSAVHMAGAEYLIQHGQHFTHLDLHNSYGQFINAYYNTSYPSGADTLFGGSAALLGLPLIWAFQPFNAFMLAAGIGPAWLLARRIGLRGVWAGLAALTAVIPALVYAYELLGSIKEVTALPLILSLGALVVCHEHWLGASPRRALPFAMLLGGGVAALGIAFGAWALVAALVLAVVIVARHLGAAQRRGTLLLIAFSAVVLALAALSTWVQLPGSVTVASNIAVTTNPGNLHSPLRASQALGIWIGGSYKLAPHGVAEQVTEILMFTVLGAVLLGAAQLLRRRAFALAGWMALMGLAWLVITQSASTWAAAKTLMLTSPVVMLLAWGGVAALRALPSRGLSLLLAGILALGLSGGVLVSDALQYHAANLAPTARYQELASLDARFAGRGPTLFTDFDEYSLYELRDLDIGGPNFVYPPATLAAAAGGYGQPVRLDLIAPAALRSYPLIITRRDPAAPRPPAAYRLQWQGAYYQVWSRRAGAPTARVHLALSGLRAQQCVEIRHLASGSGGGRLVAAASPLQVRVRLRRTTHPKHWGHEHQGLVMNHPGTLRAIIHVPFAGSWQLWLRGQLMPTIALRLDGRALASIGGQLSGNSLVPNLIPPITVRLSAGRHLVTVRRAGVTLAPGDGGAAVLDGIFLTPALASAKLDSEPARWWRALCGRRYAWVELIGSRRTLP
jgi:hypothetical protein